MRVVFMGTPQFAVPILEALAKEHEVAAVVTQPDKPKGRSKNAMPPQVKLAAEQLNIPVYQFKKIKDAESCEILESFRADVIVTAAYGQILSERNLRAAPLGVINAHASLLPEYRGPAPVNWVIINGEKTTGVTIMHTDIGIDTGDIILKTETEIKQDETAGELLARLSLLAADLMSETLKRLENGTAPRQKQDESKASRYPMLKKTDGFVNFNLPADKVKCLTLGVDPWPGAYTQLGRQPLKFFRPEIIEQSGKPGTLLSEKEFIIACGEHAVRFREVQLSGKKRMTDTDFLRGRRLEKGTVLPS